jgi:hypothetical protein
MSRAKDHVVVTIDPDGTMNVWGPYTENQAANTMEAMKEYDNLDGDAGVDYTVHKMALD